MGLIGGADGCKNGWFLVTKDLKSATISCEKCPSTKDLLHKTASLDILALDIPIGLTDKGPRKCDLQARRLLKAGRASSVFPAPIRPVLSAIGYKQACRKRFEIEGKKMPVQAWAIVGKIREVDAILQADTEIRNKVREVHPEVSFYFLAGEKPCQYSKKKWIGREERRNLLTPSFNDALKSALMDRRKFPCAEDDIMDAFAALWTAERIASGKAQTIPIESERDSFGLRMEIVA
jgi:predicted RNase H-like nuclease